jgi:heme A synthase
MSRKKPRNRWTQRVFWAISLVVVLSIAVGLATTLTGPPPRVTETPTPTMAPFPAQTP